MKKETFFCDKCEKQVDDEKGLMPVAIKYGEFGKMCITTDLCFTCAEEIGFIQRVVKDDATVNEPQNIKDRLYDVFCDLVAESLQQ